MPEIIVALVGLVGTVVVAWIQFHPHHKKQSKQNETDLKARLIELSKEKNDVHSRREEAYNELSRAIAEYLIKGSADMSLISEKLKTCIDWDEKLDHATDKFINDMISESKR